MSHLTSEVVEMTLQERLDELEADEMLVVVPPMFEVKMFGATGATINKAGMVVATYTDGETLTRQATSQLLDCPVDEITICSLVGAVQP